MSVDIESLHSAAMQASIALQNGVPNLIKQYEDEQRQRMQAIKGSIVFTEIERIQAQSDEMRKSSGLAHWSENYKNALSGLMPIDAMASFYGVENLANLCIPDCSILIRSAPKTRHQQQKADDFKAKDSAENAVILTDETADYQAIVFELGRKAGIAPPQSKEDEPLFVAHFHQMLEGQKPKDRAKETESGERTCQLHVFIWRVYSAIKEPTMLKVKREITANYAEYDDEEIIISVSDYGIEWRSKYSNDKALKWSCLSGTITKCKAKYQKQAQ